MQWPSQLRDLYPDACISQPWGFFRPVYKVATAPPAGGSWVVKYCQVESAEVASNVEVQRAWHRAGVAPAVVRNNRGRIQREGTGFHPKNLCAPVICRRYIY